MLKDYMRTLWREPLVHFLVLAVMLFALDDVFSSSSQNDRLITIGSDTKSELTATFEDSRGRPPTEQELDKLVEAWLKNEILYREGLALGLDRGDSMIRERVIHKMRLLMMNNVVVDSPSEDQLRKWFKDHRTNYDKPERFDFALVSVETDGPDGQLEAERLLASIKSGTEPERIGRLARGFRNRPRDNVVDMFGEDFVKELENRPLRQWQVMRSKNGWHVVRLDNISEGEPAKFEIWRAKIENDWRQYRHRQLANEALQEMRNNYTVQEESGS
jgi:peptidyl-prolyl cis-trans isomerase C